MVNVVHLSTRDGELFLAVLALCGLVVFQPGVTLIQEQHEYHTRIPDRTVLTIDANIFLLRLHSNSNTPGQNILTMYI